MNHKNFLLAVLSVGLVGLSVSTSSALVSFGSPAALNTTAATDAGVNDGTDNDKEPRVVVGDNGTVLNVWSSNSTLGDTVGGDFDIFVSRSTDGGRSWTAPAALNTTAASDALAADTQPQLVFGGDTHWMAVWTSGHDLGGAGTDTDILAAFSSDDGVTWGAPALVNSDATTDAGANSLDQAPSLAGRDSGSRVWLVGWQKIEGSVTQYFYSSSTTDGGAWAARTQLGSDTSTGLSQGIAVHHTGSDFVAAWSSLEGGGFGTDTDLLTAIIDETTFVASGPVPLNTDALSDSRNDKFPVIAGAGAQLVACWEGNAGVGASAGDSDIYVARSTDGGTVWSMPETLNSNGADDTGDDDDVALDADGSTFIAVWSSTDTLGKTIKDDDDILTARSTDGGLTWSTVRALASTATKDKAEDAEPSISGRDGLWVTGWRSADTLGKTLGDDDDLLYMVADQDCPSSPQTPATCFEPQASGKSSLLIKDTAKKDLLKWKFANGPAVDLGADVGDPTSTDDYVLCVYDQDSDTDELIVELDAFAGGECFVKPCWKTLSSGYLYKHKFGSMDSLSVSAGTEGKPKAQVKSSFGFPSPGLPRTVDSTLTVQLFNTSTGACWSSEYSSPKLNTATLFKAKSD